MRWATIRALAENYKNFVVELFCLFIAAPALYFPGKLPIWTVYFSLGLLLFIFIWRRWQLGICFYSTPAALPIFLLFTIFLPISVAVAPASLRQEYSIPKALILLWNFCLFWTIVTYSGCNKSHYKLGIIGFYSLGIVIALVALLGTQWNSKIPGLSPLLYLLPQPFAKVFNDADGFNPNQVAGTLSFILPLQIALLCKQLIGPRRFIITILHILLLSITGAVFVVAQSRAALAGLGLSLLIMLLMNWTIGRRLLSVSIIFMCITLPFFPFTSLLSDLDRSTVSQLYTENASFVERQEIWQRAIYAIHDFPFTGMGLGTFRKLVHILYPTFLIPNSLDFAHAHNFFLQCAVDFGVGGLIAVLSTYILAIWLLIQYILKPTSSISKWMANGLLGAIVAHSTFSMLDAIAMGSKTNLMYWYLFALIFGLHRLHGGSFTEPELQIDDQRKK